MNENMFKGFENIEETLSNVIAELDKMNESCLLIVDNLEAINQVGFDDVIDNISNVISAAGGIVDIVANWKVFTSQVKKFGDAFLNICSPIGVLTILIGGLTLAVVALEQEEDEAAKKTREFAEAEQKKFENIDKTTESLKKNAEAAKENRDAINSDYSLTLGQVDKLVKLTGKDGYVSNIEEARYLIDSINSVMPNTVELTEGNQVVWRDLNGEVEKNTDNIKKNIEMLRQKAIVEEYEKEYLEAIKNQSTVVTEKVKAENGLAEARQRYMELQEKGFDLDENELKEKGILSSQIRDYKEKIASCNEQLLVINDTTRNYQAAQQSLSNETEDMAAFMVEQYVKLDENGEKTWQSLGEGLTGLDAKIQAHEEGIMEMSEEEIKASQLARDNIVADLSKKAEQYGFSYEEMLITLKENGVNLTEQEKELMKNSIKTYSDGEKEKLKNQRESLEFMRTINDSGLSVLDEDSKKKLKERLELFQKSGNKDGLALCNSLVESLKENNGEVSQETYKILNQIEKMADNTDPNVQFNIKKPTTKSIDAVQEAINKIPSFKDITCNIKATGDEKVISLITAPLKGFATGGFPDTGELFLAREAGPELVGRINGKTAVANNDQIVSGISSGVFNAVTSAMKGMNTQGNMNIHATFVMDGDVVGKQVIKYHNGMVRRTGRSPLMI